MKKFLSLVLALVMTMSLVTISAGAKDFTDDSSIAYKEAVDVVSTIGIVDGYSDDSFRPENVLTRGAAAKIICNLLLGPTTASALSANTAPYSDVPADHTFAGYIAYCANKGIISGYADGTFRPAGTLTGYAFMKMLLGALGYDADIEGFVGANWSVNVAKTALNIGLDSGNDDFVGTKPVTREEACLYAFNTLKADLVEYDSKTTVSVNGAEVVVGGSDAKAMQWNNSATKKTNIKDDPYVQFAEQYFNKLVAVECEGDDFGRPASEWKYKGVKIGTYADDATLVYEGDVKLNEIYKDLGMSTKDETAVVYVNGLAIVEENDEGKDEVVTYTVSKSNDTKLSKIADVVGNGTIVEVYLDSDTNHVDIVVISVYAGKVSAVKEATSKKDAYVVIDFDYDLENDEFETEELEEDDIVAFTYSDKANEIKTAEKLESVEGSLTKRVVGKSLTLGSDTYKYAKEYTFEGTLSEEGLTNKSDYVVYLDANGYALWIEESEFAVDAYALIEKITSESDKDWNGNKAKLLFTDGTEKVVDLSKDFKAAGFDVNDVVRFKVEDDGEYKLIDVASDDSEAGKFSIAKKAVAGIESDVDSKTIFVIEDTEAEDFDVYTGIKNAPTVKGATAYAYAKDGVAKVIFVMGGSVENTSDDVIFVAGKSVSKRVTSSDTADYYVYNAVVKGEITTIMVKSDITMGALVAGEETNVVLNSTKMDGDDIITEGKYSSTDVTVSYNNVGVKKVSSEEIKLAGKILSVASDCNVYLIDDDGEIEEVELSDVKTNADSVAIYTMEDGEITNLFVQLPKD